MHPIGELCYSKSLTLLGVLARLEDVGEISILGQKLYEVFFSVTHRVAISALPNHATVPINLKSASAPSQERFPRVNIKEVKVFFDFPHFLMSKTG